MTNITNEMIEDAIKAGFTLIKNERDNGFPEMLEKFAELTLKRGSGEAVGYISLNALTNLKDDKWKALRGAHEALWPTNNPPNRANIPLYTTRQQSHDVASALEMAAKICDVWALSSANDEFGLGQKFTSENIAEAIRALITAPPTTEVKQYEELLEQASKCKISIHLHVDGDVQYILATNRVTKKQATVFYKARDMTRCRVNNFNDALMLAITEALSAKPNELKG